MTDTEKLAEIRTVLEDLKALKRHLVSKGWTDRFVAAEADSLHRVVEIVGFSFAEPEAGKPQARQRRARSVNTKRP